MSKRNTENLDADPQQPQSKEPSADHRKDSDQSSPAVASEPTMVSVHFPKPVFLSQILPEISGWSGFNFVMDPELNRKMQVFAPRRVAKEEAFQIFVASLETIGLRVLQIDSNLIKIVPETRGQRAA